MNGHPLAWLDNAATTQKPAPVIDTVRDLYETGVANVRRGVHALAARCTDRFEGARGAVAEWIGAASPGEIVFTRGTTEAINLVAQSVGRRRVGAGDEVVVTGLEHHANLVPWQLLCEAVGARLVAVAVEDDGAVDPDRFAAALTARTRIAAFAHASNALGTILPVAQLCRAAASLGVLTVVDGAQAVPHLPVDVAALGCDFYAFSGHKVFGPSGVGVLWASSERLAGMPPWQGGGEMIETVTLEGATWAAPPHRFEAGTPNIEGVVGLGAAIEWMRGWGPGARAHEDALADAAMERLSEIPGLRIWGTARPRVPLVAFTLEGVHPHDIGTVADLEGVAIRTGHHCAQLAMARFGLEATARASFAPYNTLAEVDRLVGAVRQAAELFR